MIDAFDWLTLGVLVGLFVALGGVALWMAWKGGDADDAGGERLQPTADVTPPLGISEPAAAPLPRMDLTDEMIEAQSWAVHPTWSVKHRWSRIDYVNGATWARDFLNESITAHND